MPNYLEIIGQFYPEADVRLSGSNMDPTNYDHIIWVSDQISQAELDSHIQHVQESLQSMVTVPLATPLHDEIPIYDSTSSSFILKTASSIIGDGYSTSTSFNLPGSSKRRFMNSVDTDSPSNDTTFVAPKSGEIIAVVFSTKSNPESNWFLKCIKNATSSGTGQFAGGTQFGADIEKPADCLDCVITGLSGYQFLANDRISAYVEGGTSGDGKAWQPLVTLYLRYN